MVTRVGAVVAWEQLPDHHAVTPGLAPFFLSKWPTGNQQIDERPMKWGPNGFKKKKKKTSCSFLVSLWLITLSTLITCVLSCV